MPLQFRRGTDAQRTAVTPAAGEPIWVTDTQALYVGDGSTAGGVAITDHQLQRQMTELMETAIEQVKSEKR
jgi:hypothetical protein